MTKQRYDVIEKHRGVERMRWTDLTYNRARKMVLARPDDRLEIWHVPEEQWNFPPRSEKMPETVKPPKAAPSTSFNWTMRPQQRCRCGHLLNAHLKGGNQPCRSGKCKCTHLSYPIEFTPDQCKWWRMDERGLARWAVKQMLGGSVATVMAEDEARCHGVDGDFDAPEDYSWGTPSFRYRMSWYAGLHNGPWRDLSHDRWEDGG